MKIVDAPTMTRIDASAQAEYGIPSLVLMEDAGLQGWQIARDALRRDGVEVRQPVVVAGRGANGGDAFVMARHARLSGASPTVVLAGGRPEPASDAGANLHACEGLGVPVVSWPVQEEAVRAALASADVIFDGIAGTGLRGALRPPLDLLVQIVNAASGRRVAIDVPSGLRDGWRDSEPTVEAWLTLAMGLPKACCFLPRARRRCGRIAVVAVGFPPGLVDDPRLPVDLLEEGCFAALARPIASDAHKGDRGHLAVFAGSPGTTGAAWLAAHAAARARIGLVSLYLDSWTWPILAPRCTSVMAKPWDAAAGATALPDPSRWTGMLVGPGWGVASERLAALDGLLSVRLPGVLDADALTLLGRLARGARGRLGGRWVLTPHPGEFVRLSGGSVSELLDDPLPRASALAADLEAVVVLKGNVTVISAPDGRSCILDGGNPALATAGSGDVLAGLVAAGIASGLGPLDAARFGVSLHARLGRLAARRRGWFLAEDLVPLVSAALGRALRRGLTRG